MELQDQFLIHDILQEVAVLEVMLPLQEEQAVLAVEEQVPQVLTIPLH